jgi:CelD/BcsL family acetyltransferase involved in cellulose biosynthesis
MAWRFTWMRSWKAVWEPANVAAWRAMFARPEAHATPFMHPDIVRAWWEAIGGEDDFAPFFLQASHADGQEVRWLLVRPRTDWRTGLMRRMAPAGTRLFDYRDPVVAPVKAAGDVLVAGFWTELRRELLRHEGDWFDTCAFASIRPACFGGGDFAVRAGIAPFVRLDVYADFDAYIAARRPSLVKDVRYNFRRTDAAGGSEYHVYGPGETDAVLAWLPDLEAARLARYPDTPLPAGYLRALAVAGIDRGLVHASTLALEGRIVSWDLSFFHDGIFYNYARAIDGAAARFSPGRLHQFKTMEWLFAHGARIYDCMLGAEDYKADWTDGEEVRPRSAAILSNAPATRLRNYATRGLRFVMRPDRRRVPAAARGARLGSDA